VTVPQIMAALGRKVIGSPSLTLEVGSLHRGRGSPEGDCLTAICRDHPPLLVTRHGSSLSDEPLLLVSCFEPAFVSAH
jgi:hypothetical protein